MNSKIIIYDDNCPLCSAYTSAFVKTGFLGRDGRKDFSNISPDLLKKINIQKSVNEIPLIDTNTNKVWYGIDALLELLNEKIPGIKTIGNIQPLKWILQKFYKFISYNRRVIVASKKKETGFDCSPDFNIRYRFLFMAVFLVFNTLMLFPLQQYVLGKSIFHSNIISLQIAHALFVAVNVSIGLLLKRRDTFEYLGQINMIALMAILLCTPLIVINRYVVLRDGLFNSYYLGMVTLFVIHEYLRRMKYLSFNKKYKKIILVNFTCLTAFITYLIL